jgi:hypothetical protein
MKTLIKIILAPFTGLVFFLALPIISVCLIAYTICERTYVGVRVAAGRMVYFSWRPNEAYLSGRKSKEKKVKEKKIKENKEV